MASRDFIECVRNASNIIEIAGELTTLETAGETAVGHCPFHSEQTASFTIYPDQNSYHCYGCKRNGSVFDLVMESQGIEFWDSVLYLANRYGIPVLSLSAEEQAQIVLVQQIERLLGEYVEQAHEHLNQEAIDYLHERGVTDDSINTHRIGLGARVKKESDVNQEASGLTDSRLIGRLIFPIKRGGRVVQVSARTLTQAEPKYLSLARPLWPWNAHRLRQAKCILVEGVLDAMLLEQAGYPACSTIGTTMKREWLSLIGKNTDCVCCYDQDDAGKSANRTVGGMLLDAEHRVYVATLPVGHDPASFIQAEGAGAFQVVLDSTQLFVDMLIDSLPTSLNEYDMAREMTLLFARLAKFPATAQERFIAKIAGRLSLNKMAIRKELGDYLRENTKREEEESGSVIEWKIKRRETNPIFFNPGQDVIDGILYYVIYFETEYGTFRPFVITSTKEAFPYRPDTLVARNLICKVSAVPSNFGRWSIGTDHPYNALDYLDSKTHVDVRQMYQDVRFFFTHFIRFPDKFYYDFFACWTIATYHYRLYDSFGYIFLNAAKRSGKTQTLSIVNQLAFNACMATALTEAVLKRRVNADAATMIADEAEFFKEKLRDEKSMVFEVFNGGYKRTGRASMVDPDTKIVEDFCTYSPKALANTGGLYDVLADRCILIHLLRSEHKVPDFIEAKFAERLQLLRDMLYCFSLEYIGDLTETKREFIHPDNLPGRDWELWLPVLNTAKFLDAHEVVDPEEFELADGTKQTIANLYERMLTMAIERREYKIMQEEEAQEEPRVLRALVEFMENNPALQIVGKPGSWYSVSEIVKYIKEDMGWDKYSAKRFYHLAFDILKIANRKTDKDRARDYVDGKAIQKRFIRLDTQIVQQRGKQLFSMEFKTEPESSEWTDPDVPDET